MPEKETHNFGAEVEKIFQLVIHSLYEHKEIFLRELISNASDACDRLRYKAITSPDLTKDDPDFKITLTVDKEKNTLTIRDNGIGMTKAEMVKNLGTIARSGTQGFLEKLTGEAKQDSQLIGQFGVGFYSAFMVASDVTVISQAAGKKKAHLWHSKGDGKYTIEEAKEALGRGTSVTVHLRDEEKEYLDKHRIRHIVETYSNHIAFDIVFVGEGGEEEVLNEGTALWLKDKAEITEEEYKEFYQGVSFMGMDEPWMTLHNKAEGVVSYINLLFVPTLKPFDLFHPDRQTRVKLYINRVFIAEEGIEIIPQYLRFLRGVVDSDDLPLNISRETVQNNAIVQKIKCSITKKVLGELKKKAEKDPEAYTAFWENFGPVLKEGLCEGMEPRDELLEACRFRSTLSEDKWISMQQYVDRMKDGQEAIYYIVGDEGQTIVNSPQLEGFKKKGIEVLLLTDHVDSFWVSVLNEYHGTPLMSVTRAGTEVEEKKEGEEEGEKEEGKREDSKGMDSLVAFIKVTLGDVVSDVRTTSKLTDSPVCLTVPEGGMDMRLERFMVANKQIPGMTAKILEINPSHPIIKKLAADAAKKEKPGGLDDTVHLLFAQANIIEGEPLSDPAAFTKRMNALLEKALAA